MTGALFLLDVKLFAGETANGIIRIFTVSPGKHIGICHTLTLEGQGLPRRLQWALPSKHFMVI
jgi:hypothetical protein